MAGESSPWNSFSVGVTLGIGGLSFMYVAGTLVNDSANDGFCPNLSEPYVAPLHNSWFSSVGN